MITVKDLNFAYDTTSLFNNLSLTINEGNILRITWIERGGKNDLT